MKVKCAICCKEEEITKLHKDYQKLSHDAKAVYICEMCSFKLSHQAAKENGFKEKI
ncbi:MAG: DUF2197 domain-containing protein [Clostridiales bacterium]